MKPIISPWFFYFVDKANFLDIISFFGVVTTFIFLVLIKVYIISEEPYNTKELEEICKKLKKFFIIFIIIASTVPSKDTLYKMLIASQITPNNINAAGETITEGIDYIFDKINETIEKEKGE